MPKVTTSRCSSTPRDEHPKTLFAATNDKEKPRILTFNELEQNKRLTETIFLNYQNS